VKNGIPGLYPYQEEDLRSIICGFEKGHFDRICYGAACTSGKTFVGIAFAVYSIKYDPGTKILILAHGTTVLRSQFFGSATESYGELVEPLGDFRVCEITKASDIDKYYATHNVFIAIPQTLHKIKKLPKFDLVICDEGHQFYFAQMVDKIIKRCHAKRVLALTGTPYQFIQKKWKCIIRALNELPEEMVQQKYVVELVNSNYTISKDDYENDEIPKKKENILTRAATYEAMDNCLEKVLTFLVSRAKAWGSPGVAAFTLQVPAVNKLLTVFKTLGKTMVICRNQKQARMVEDYFRERDIPVLISTSDHENSEESVKTFEAFKTADIKILIVVDRGILGFNFSELANIFDLTCSANIIRIWQAQCRVFRPFSHSNQPKLFMKVIPDLVFNGSHNKSLDYFRGIMTMAMSFSDRYWLGNFDGFNGGNLKIPVGRRHENRHFATGKKNRKSQKEQLPVLPDFLSCMNPVEVFKKLYSPDLTKECSVEYTTWPHYKACLFNFKKYGPEGAKLTATEICEWMKAHNDNTPNKKSADPLEKDLGKKLDQIRQCKKGKGKFWPAYQEIAEKYGYPEIWNTTDFDSINIQTWKELVAYVSVHHHLPDGSLLSFWKNRKKAKNSETNRYKKYPHDKKYIAIVQKNLNKGESNERPCAYVTSTASLSGTNSVEGYDAQ